MQSISQIRLPCDRSAESPDCKTDCIVYAQKIIQSASWQAIARQTKKYLAVLDILCRLYNQLLPEPTILGYQSLKNFNLTSKSCSASNFNAEKYQIPNTIDLCRDYNFFFNCWILIVFCPALEPAPSWITIGMRHLKKFKRPGQTWYVWQKCCK